MSDLTTINDTIEIVATEAEAAETARADRLTAEAALLTAIINKSKRALNAIGTRPKIAYSVSHHADVNYCGGNQTTEHYPHRCVCLSHDDGFGPEKDCPRANSGTYTGRDLALRADGALICLAYTGDWSCWQGSSWGWQADITEYDSVAAAQRDGWTDVDDYVERLSSILTASIGRRTSRAESDRRRADKIRAILSLL